ncbi:MULTISPECIES: septum site-determining protein MinC [Moraxella]|uniref:Probable septum site-determining protein MinC n=1 Tax=Moraxella catarrhalis TaxID=480 RepID=A0A7Z1A3U6_MORCA|nr:septum site-determining protein MinC [Moraxella catarrhalis]OAV00348.1 Septum site-determining protein MinC [Moraxella catarrhalis]STY82602.1 Septum site-determining protein MinC [Moraxella catarrhalis]
MTQAVTLFGKMLTFSRLKVHTDDLTEIRKDLMQVLSDNPIASGLPIVIDSTVDLELDALIDMLWLMDVQPIGVVSGPLDDQARDLRLAIFPADGKRIERLPNTEDKSSPKIDPNQSSAVSAPDHGTDKPISAAAVSIQQGSTLSTAQDNQRSLVSGIHTHMLRSGQSLQHLGGDLTVIGGVNDGAEAITDNSLHIYGRGLGRLVAGATGDKDARIFCQKFNPSLVSVAGTYCLRDAIPSEMIDQAVQVTYDEEKGLVFTLLNQL